MADFHAPSGSVRVTWLGDFSGCSPYVLGSQVPFTVEVWAPSGKLGSTSVRGTVGLGTRHATSMVWAGAALAALHGVQLRVDIAVTTALPTLWTRADLVRVSLSPPRVLSLAATPVSHADGTLAGFEVSFTGMEAVAQLRAANVSVVYWAAGFGLTNDTHVLQLGGTDAGVKEVEVLGGGARRFKVLVATSPTPVGATAVTAQVSVVVVNSVGLASSVVSVSAAHASLPACALAGLDVCGPSQAAAGSSSQTCDQPAPTLPGSGDLFIVRTDTNSVQLGWRASASSGCSGDPSHPGTLAVFSGRGAHGDPLIVVPLAGNGATGTVEVPIPLALSNEAPSLTLCGVALVPIYMGDASWASAPAPSVCRTVALDKQPP